MADYKTKLMELRKHTHHSVSLGNCFAALKEAGGDVDQALDLLTEQGFITKPRNRFFDFTVPKGAPPHWVYILSKASKYLKLGPDTYRKGDALEMPPEEWDVDTLQKVESCFQQFLDGKGHHKDYPVENVGVGGFYRALETLHFDVREQAALRCDTSHATSMAFIDMMVFEHVVTEDTITLYNKVVYDDTDSDDD